MYLPKGMEKSLKNFMRSKHLRIRHVIPLWSPVPTREANARGRIRFEAGDVGTFTALGGFKVAFSILMSETTNDLCGHLTPPDFTQFFPHSGVVFDSGTVIDLESCGAIQPARHLSSGAPPICIGFTKTFHESRYG
jgi:hypothetical protein